MSNTDSQSGEAAMEVHRPTAFSPVEPDAGTWINPEYFLAGTPWIRERERAMTVVGYQSKVDASENAKSHGVLKRSVARVRLGVLQSVAYGYQDQYGRFLIES